jgi:hypothetical protein
MDIYGPLIAEPMSPKPPKILTRIQTHFDQLDDNPFADSFSFHPTGSRFTCSPPILDTDEDWICHIQKDAKGFERAYLVEGMLVDEGFETSEDQGENYPDCISYRKGDINIIVVYDDWVYKNWVKATQVCKYLNLLKKEDRKMVHRIICGEPI